MTIRTLTLSLIAVSLSHAADAAFADLRVELGVAPGVDKTHTSVDIAATGKTVETDTNGSGTGRTFAVGAVWGPGPAVGSGAIVGIGFTHRVHDGSDGVKLTANALWIPIGYAKTLTDTLTLEVPITLMPGIAKEDATQSSNGLYLAGSITAGVAWEPIRHLVVSADAGYGMFWSTAKYDDPRSAGSMSAGSGAVIVTRGSGLTANLGVGYRF